MITLTVGEYTVEIKHQDKVLTPESFVNVCLAVYQSKITKENEIREIHQALKDYLPPYQDIKNSPTTKKDLFQCIQQMMLENASEAKPMQNFIQQIKNDLLEERRKSRNF